MLSGLHGQALFTWLARACLATVGVATGDRSIVSEQYPALKAREGCLLLMTVSMDRLLGNLAQAMHEPETATRHYEDALKWTRRAGYLPELAWTCHDYAEMLLNDRSGDPDRARVDKLIREAEAIASRLSMRPLSGRMDALRQLLTTRPRRTTGLP
ncbi:MAG: hypothetical protein HY682_12540 [Chloroflexi bacterium]|nr:hypothetical protein [Chloroflexota bacterium]